MSLAGCGREIRPEFSPVASTQPGAGQHLPQYGFGVRPAGSSRQLWQRYAALIDEVNRRTTGFRLRLESAQTDSTYEAKLHKKRFDIAIVEPHRVLEAETLGYNVFARAGSKDRISAIIIVRRDSEISRLTDLKGKTITFSSPGTLAPTMLVRLYMARQAFDPNRYARCEYVGSQESALLRVYLRSSSAAAVSKSAWDFFVAERSLISEELEPKWYTNDLPGSGLMAINRVPPLHVKQLQRAFAELRNAPDGVLAMNRAGFTDIRPGESGTYDDLWEFMNDYRRAFGRLPPLGAAR